MSQSVNANKIFTNQIFEKLATEEYSKISDGGMNLEYNSNTYHVEQFSNDNPTLRVFSIIFNDESYTQILNLETQSSSFFGDREVSIPNVLDILADNLFKEENEKLNEKDQEPIKEFSIPIPSDKGVESNPETATKKGDKSWTRIQKAGLLMASLLATAILGFGAKKLMNRMSEYPKNNLG